MKKYDFDSFDALMQGIAENYGQTLTPQGIALRFRALESYGLEDVKRATMAILNSRKYTSMPTIADFVEFLGGGSAEDIGQVEAGKVLQAIREIGPYNSVVFDDPVTQAVIRQNYGGWPKLCEDCGQEEPEKWFLINFSKSYSAYRRTGTKHYGILPGLHEIHNSANGLIERFPSVPRLVGNKEKANMVMISGKENVIMAKNIKALGEK